MLSAIKMRVLFHKKFEKGLTIIIAGFGLIMLFFVFPQIFQLYDLFSQYKLQSIRYQKLRLGMTREEVESALNEPPDFIIEFEDGSEIWII